MGESVLPCAVPGESSRMFPRHKWKERHLDAYTQTPVCKTPDWDSHSTSWAPGGHHGHHFLLPTVAIGLLQSSASFRP